ncbi:MAG: hypothetical protein KJO76_08280 [Gammaproteobacteria bacterium]|nr:hypothetical protein [Gammaproteobacteria bacterium]NND36126.1 hypothetical protein [Gammaproteobacteria bacterium]
METNELPTYDMSENPTGCCPRFDPTGWDAQDLHFRDKHFARVTTRSIAHFPLNMGSVFKQTLKALEDADAQNEDDFIVLSHDRSAWSAEHLFSVNKFVPGQEIVQLSGDYVTKVFEGPYRNMPKWHAEMKQLAGNANGGDLPIYFFYTTCPKCQKYYGKNYVVGVAQAA